LVCNYSRCTDYEPNVACFARIFLTRCVRRRVGASERHSIMADFKKLFGKKTYNDPRIERYESLLQQSSEPNPDLHFKLGRLYQHEKEVIEAVKHYEAAAKLYAQTKQYLGALVSYKIMAVLNPEDRDALAHLANIEFETSIKLTEQAFKKFLEERGESVSVKSSNISKTETEAEVKPKSRAAFQRARGQHEQEHAHTDALFQEKRKRLVDLISGDASDENDTQFQKGRQEFLSLLEDDPSAFQAPGERLSAPKTLLPQEDACLIDLTQQPTQAPPSDEKNLTRKAIEALILHNPLFAPLSDAEKDAMIRQSAVRDYDEDATIMRYPSDRMELFVVVTGEVYLIKESDSCRSRSEVIQVNPGECWGEHTLFAPMKPCAFSVMASNGTTVLEISQDDLKEFTRKYPPFFEQLKALCERRWCQNALALFPLFGELSMAEQQLLLPLFSEVMIKEGEMIIREGDTGQSMFLIASGDVEVFTTLVEEGDVQVVQAGESHLFLAKLRVGDCFGEGAFFTNEPRSATVQALTETKLLKLGDRHLQKVLHDYPGIARKLQQCHEKRVRETMAIIQHAFAA